MLIFDFDGVLINSIDEVTLSAYNAVTGSLKTALSDLPAELVRLYQSNRFQVQPAGDQPVLMAWCIENYQASPHKILTPEAFYEVILANTTPLVERTRQFYERRQVFIDTAYQKWLALHSPFQPIWNALIERGANRVVILTNKNRTALKVLCRQHRLEVCDENIYSGDKGASKIENLEKIHARFNCSRYDLVDDSLKNLRELDRRINRKAKLLYPILAAWGYIGPQNKQQALDCGYRIYEQNDLIADLDEHLPQ